MNRVIRTFAGASILCLLFLGFQGTASAVGSDKCTAITALPATISAPGAYCLTGDLSSSQGSLGVITITVDDVVLDLGGHTLNGLGAGSTTLAVGIYSLDHRNITVQNGTVRGFCNGIDLNDSGAGASQGHLVQNLRVDGSKCIGIHVVGAGSVIQNNQVLDTLGNVGLANIDGIFVGGTGVRVVNNDVENIFVAGESNSYAIRIDTTGNGAVVENNQIANATLPAGHFKSSFGIEIDGTSNVIVVNNRMTMLNIGVAYNGSSTGKYRDNLTSGVVIPYTGGIDMGNNN
jgi:hypothetical protein